MASVFPIDCFVTSNRKRSYFEKLTVQALQLSGFNPIIVEAPMLERYFECERRTTTPLYILCDDDIIPATQDTLKSLVEVMEAHPEYSQLGLGWRQNMNQEENSPWIRDKRDGLWEMHSVGGCMVIRKGTIKDLGIKPEFPSGYGDDRVMGETARKLGYKVGIVPHLYFHHLGHGNLTTFNK